MKQPSGPARQIFDTPIFVTIGDSRWAAFNHRMLGAIRWVPADQVWDYHAPTVKRLVKEGKMEMPDIPGGPQDSPVNLEWSHSKLLSKLTKLSELLCNPLWGTGQMKGERCVMLFLKPTGVGALLKLQNPSLELSVQAVSFDEAFAALEACLRMEKVPWRRSEKPLGPPIRIKKK